MLLARPTFAALALQWIVVALPAPSLAQVGDETPGPTVDAAIAGTCSGAEHRAFDFWLGDWVVTADGRVAGHNTIRRVAGGCGLLESWRSARGGTGRSVNFYDPSDGRWHQLWIGSNGLRLRLRGRISDGAMVLTGERSGENGEQVRDRITWTALEGGGVRQHWEASVDGGGNWRTVFDGVYRRP